MGLSLFYFWLVCQLAVHSEALGYSSQLESIVYLFFFMVGFASCRFDFAFG